MRRRRRDSVGIDRIQNNPYRLCSKVFKIILLQNDTFLLGVCLFTQIERTDIAKAAAPARSFFAFEKEISKRAGPVSAPL